MPAVAEVTFKATGQQGVISAFNSVGAATTETTTKINQNSSAMKTLGGGMKSSVASIGQVATAFATLSLSVVNTWRAYRDLGDAQIAVDKANLRVAKTTEAIRKTEAEVAKLKKENAKGGAASVAATNKIRLAEEKLMKARKDGKHSAAEIAVMEDQLNELKKSGTGSSQKLTDAENKLALQKEQLGVQTDVAKEAQERFNDAQQNFYLSILPTALSGFASLSLAFSGMKGMFSGGGGLIGMFGPIGLAIAGVSLAIVAFQTNFLGLRDKIGGVITWIKERFGAWKDTLEEVFAFIQKGDWGGAFNRIKQAAIDFWNDLVKSVPFFGGVATLADQIANGNWSGAFDTIKSAAVTFWTQLKEAVPLFGTIETVIKQITEGKWEDAFKTIGSSIKKGFEAVLGALGGEKLILKFQLMKDTAVRTLTELAGTLTAKGGAFDLINQGIAKLGSGDIVGGFSGIAAGIKKGIDDAKAALFAWIQLNFGIDLKTLETQANALGDTILTKIKEGLTFVARTWIDPIVVALLDPATWIAAVTALSGALSSVGTAIWTFLAGAITTAVSDPKGSGDWWRMIGESIWFGITNWMETNLPNATAAIGVLVQTIVDGFNAAAIDFQNVGITWWNNIVDGFKRGLEAANQISTLGGLLTNQVKQAIDSPEWKELGHIALIEPTINPKPAVSQTKKEIIDPISKMKPKIDIDAEGRRAKEMANKIQQSINNMKASIQVSAVWRGRSSGRDLFKGGGFGFAHGTKTTVKRPTMFMAGEGGRPEDVYVKPRGSAGLGPSGGGFNGIINVYVDGVLQKARYDMGARK